MRFQEPGERCYGSMALIERVLCADLHHIGPRASVADLPQNRGGQKHSFSLRLCRGTAISPGLTSQFSKITHSCAQRVGCGVRDVLKASRFSNVCVFVPMENYICEAACVGEQDLLWLLDSPIDSLWCILRARARHTAVVASEPILDDFTGMPTRSFEPRPNHVPRIEASQQACAPSSGGSSALWIRAESPRTVLIASRSCLYCTIVTDSPFAPFAAAGCRDGGHVLQRCRQRLVPALHHPQQINATDLPTPFRARSAKDLIVVLHHRCFRKQPRYRRVSPAHHDRLRK